MAIILIDLLLVVAIGCLWWMLRLEKQQRRNIPRYFSNRIHEEMSSRERGFEVRIRGLLTKTHIKASIAGKMAEKAHSLATGAALGVAVLQKVLPRLRPATKEQEKQQAHVKEELHKLFSDERISDYLRPVLSAEDLDILEKSEDHFEKFNSGSNGG
jgi:hypothetical protein